MAINLDLNLMAAASDLLHKPKFAFFSLLAAFVLELAFPVSENPALHINILLFSGICALLIGQFVVFGKKRADNEREAAKKVPYVGVLFFLPDRTKVEELSNNGQILAVMLSPAIVILNLFVVIFNIWKIAALILRYVQ